MFYFNCGLRIAQAAIKGKLCSMHTVRFPEETTTFHFLFDLLHFLSGITNKSELSLGDSRY